MGTWGTPNSDETTIGISELGSDKPYDGCSEVEVTLDIPVVSWGWRVRRGIEVGTNTSGDAVALTTAYSILSRAWRVAGEEGR